MPNLSPPKPDLTVLENRWLHKAFLFFTWFETAPLAINLGWLAVVLSANFGLWRAFAPDLATTATLLLVGFVSLDIGLLWLLPRFGRSHGRIFSQLIVMVLPRLGVMGLGLLLSRWGPSLGLWTIIALQAAGTLSFLWGMGFEPHRLALTRLKITSPHLPTDAPPIRLLHLSDIHLERLTQREHHLLTLIDSARPDVIVITGDYLNLSYTHDPTSIAQVRDLLAQIDAPCGVFATLGSPPVDVPDVAPHHFSNSHIRLLRHEVVEVDVGQNRHLRLLGMDCTHDMVYDSHQLAALSNGRLSEQTTVLLYHSPELMPHAQAHPIDLFLCGHTHGGQIRVPGYGAIVTSSSTGKRFEMGRYDENGTTLYVSRGIGLEGMCAPRMRLFCPPEVTLLEIGGR